MAYFKAKLTEQGFPFNFQELAGTVLIGNALEQNLQGQQAGQETPQAYFMQNVVPTQRGYVGIHYNKSVAEHTYPKYLDKIFVLYDVGGSVALYSTAYGQRYVYDKDIGSWAAFPLPSGTPVGDTTVAYLKGTTYILIAGVGLYKYDFSIQALVELTLTGVTAASLDGITAASLYLIGWDETTVYWSNPLNATDFVPAQGGAGSSAILSNRSRILQCLPSTDSFIAYTNRSAIYCQATGNANYPFSFREIPSSAGVAENEHVAYDAPNDRHIAWTTSGFQLVTQKGASLLWPELSDSIAQGLYSNAADKEYPYIVKSDKLLVKVSSIGARYIAVSIKRNAAQPNYNHAYLYDIALERWGRLDIPHIDIFEYRAPEFAANIVWQAQEGSWDDDGSGTWEQLVADVPTKTSQFGYTIAAVTANGSIYVALPSTANNINSLESPSSSAVTPSIFFGRYRLQRQAAVQVQQVQIGNQNLQAAVAFYSHDASGAKLRKLVPTASASYATQYWGRLTGAHISIQLTGRLNLTSLESELTTQGNMLLPAVGSAQQLSANAVVVNDIPVIVNDVQVEVN